MQRQAFANMSDGGLAFFQQYGSEHFIISMIINSGFLYISGYISSHILHFYLDLILIMSLKIKKIAQVSDTQNA